MTTSNKITPKVSYQRLLEVLHRYVDTDWNAMGNSEPIYRILTEECGCTHDELIDMGFDWIPQVQDPDDSNWFLTDSDSFQICREHSDGSFEFYQISLISENCPRRFAVSHDLVYTDQLSDEELKTICDCYSSPALMMFIRAMGIKRIGYSQSFGLSSALWTASFSRFIHRLRMQSE